MESILSKVGQSNYDICNSIYGNFDCFIKMLNDNDIKNSKSIANLYYFDKLTSGINTNVIGITYSTSYLDLQQDLDFGYVNEDESSFYSNSDSSGSIYIPST